MLFHTWTFFIFFIVALTGLVTLRPTRYWLHWLLVSSYIFYGWWNPYYLALIFYSTALDYIVVLLMDKCRPGETSFCRKRLSGSDFVAPSLQLTYLLSLVVCVASVFALVLGPSSMRTLLAGVAIVSLMMAGGSLFQSRVAWLWVSIVNNLSILVFFKYADFFIANINAVLAQCSITWSFPEAATLMPFSMDYLLPVGISFFTFQSMSYTIDFYFGNVRIERSFFKFATFVSFFPQLVAGPIERAKHLLPQFDHTPTITRKDIGDGLSLFLVGLFKKLALANYLSYYAERAFNNPSEASATTLVLGVFAFAWQIYFDFSGYTDMARGVARCMGFRLMLNFNNPYVATSLGDFWSRWHISLSTWFRDYVYIPLGGNRDGPWRTYANLFITFVISGFWHGAAWTFIIWGGLHALGVIITRNLERSEWYRNSMPRSVKQVAVFAFVCFAWIFFRAESMGDAWIIITRIATASWLTPDMPILMFIMAGIVWLYQLLYESKYHKILHHGYVRVGMVVSMIVYMFLFSTSGGEFIYFQF